MSIHLSRRDALIAGAFRAARADILNKEPDTSHADMQDGVSLAAEHLIDTLIGSDSPNYRRAFREACGVSS